MIYNKGIVYTWEYLSVPALTSQFKVILQLLWSQERSAYELDCSEKCTLIRLALCCVMRTKKVLNYTKLEFFPVVLYAFDTWSVTLKERLRVSEKEVL
jgi:hypothetical protein